MTPKKSNILWHGAHLDGKLSLMTTDNPFVIQYCMKSIDVELVGVVDISECDLTDSQEMVDTVIAAVDNHYLQRVQFHMKAKVESGEAQYQ